MDRHDYTAAANVWQRVNPAETPYPEAERGRFEGQMQSAAPPMPILSAPPKETGGDGQALYRTLLREEMRHLQQVLSVLEKALA